MTELEIIIIDCETGGLDTQKHGMTQACAMRGKLKWDPSSPTAITFEYLSHIHEIVSPDPTFEYEQEALDYQGVTLDYLNENGSTITAVLGRISAFVEKSIKDGASVWAQEDTFDFGFFRSAMKYDFQFGNNDERLRDWAGVKNIHREHYWDRSRWNCSKRFIRMLNSMKIANIGSDSLDPACKYFGIERPVGWETKPVQDCWMTGHLIAFALSAFRAWTFK